MKVGESAEGFVCQGLNSSLIINPLDIKMKEVDGLLIIIINL